jgi:hypothetical protein
MHTLEMSVRELLEAKTISRETAAPFIQESGA